MVLSAEPGREIPRPARGRHEQRRIDSVTVTASAAPVADLGFRRTFASVYLPTTIYESGVGAITPVIPLTAMALGASTSQAALTVALLGLGQVVGDIPAGHVAARLGDRKAMLYGTVVTLVVLVACTLARNWLVLAAGVFCLGAVNALFVLARQAYLTEVTHPLRRSRALSMLGGMQRVGALIGPFIGGALMALAGAHLSPGLRRFSGEIMDGDWLPAAYFLAIALTIATGLVVLLVPDVELPDRVIPKETSAIRILRTNWRLFTTLGAAFVLVGAVRQTRAVVLPLWAEAQGMSASQISYIFGISGLLDVALFYPGGRLMDKRGRMWVAIPSMIVLGSSLLLLPVARSFVGLAIVALIMGLGNGLGSGMLMTIGADLAPPKIRAQFLSLCRMFGDSGGALGPLVIAQAVAFFGALTLGVEIMGFAGLLAAAILGTQLPNYTVHANRHTRRKHGLTSHGETVVDDDPLSQPPRNFPATE